MNSQFRRYYMDNAATSFPKPQAVTDAMVHYATQVGASAGRGAYREAVESGVLIAECRHQLCRFFHGEKPENFIFTLNCSDALNLALKGMVLGRKNAHVICTEIDHNSILRPLNALADRGEVIQTRIPVEPVTGFVDPDDIARAIRPNTQLIAITHASNVTGTLQPLRQIGATARAHGVPLLVDAAQSAGHVPIDVQADGVDLLAVPGHKGLLGPLGTGFLYIRPGLENVLQPIKEGGTGSVSEQDRQPDFMPDKFEPGSHNAIGISGLNAALKWHGTRNIADLAAHDRALSETFLAGIREVDGLTYYGPQGTERRVGVFSVTIEGIAPLELSARLESQFGILTRPGLHCAPLIHRALGTLAKGGTTRFSFGPFLTKEDVAYAAQALARIAGAAPAANDPHADAAEFERLSRCSKGNSQGWKFNREELHERQ
jgi:cysteine desulfurase family protein